MIFEFSLVTRSNGERRFSPIDVPATVCQLEELESRILPSATPIAAQFNAANNFGLTQIDVNGQNLLVGNGFQIIGSKSGADTESNISSESAYSSGGILRPFDDRAAGGSLPFSLTFNNDAQDASKLNFTASLGSSTSGFATVSIPMECNAALFSSWTYSGSSTLNSYAQNPIAYGNYGIAKAAGVEQWGEIVGENYTIRVTITSSSVPLGLYFVNAPSLAGGDRDVEFSFGALQANQAITVSGFIQVFATNGGSLPAAIYQTASSPSQNERQDSEGWRPNSSDAAGRNPQDSPYANGGASGIPTSYSGATFPLSFDDGTLGSL